MVVDLLNNVKVIIKMQLKAKLLLKAMGQKAKKYGNYITI
jgi:hypothetical protein